LLSERAIPKRKPWGDLQEAVRCYIDEGIERKTRATKKLIGRANRVKTDKIRI
jgi:hypothetical protein